MSDVLCDVLGESSLPQRQLLLFLVNFLGGGGGLQHVYRTRCQMDPSSAMRCVAKVQAAEGELSSEW